MEYKNRPDRFYRDASQLRFCVHDWTRSFMVSRKPVRSYVDGIKAYKSALEKIIYVTPEVNERVRGCMGCKKIKE